MKEADSWDSQSEEANTGAKKGEKEGSLPPFHVKNSAVKGTSRAILSEKQRDFEFSPSATALTRTVAD